MTGTYEGFTWIQARRPRQNICHDKGTLSSPRITKVVMNRKIKIIWTSECMKYLIPCQIPNLLSNSCWVSFMRSAMHFSRRRSKTFMCSVRSMMVQEWTFGKKFNCQPNAKKIKKRLVFSNRDCTLCSSFNDNKPPSSGSWCQANMRHYKAQERTKLVTLYKR